MTDEALWALGRGTGITALAFMTVSLFLGIATRSGRPLLVLPRFAVASVHRFAALAATLLVVLHLVLLFFDPFAQLRLVKGANLPYNKLFDALTHLPAP